MRTLRVTCLGITMCLVPLTGAAPTGAAARPAAPAAVTTVVPVASVALPAAVDNASFYEAQTQCDPVARPGSLALGNLLRATYGPSTIYVTRACSGSTSEHFDGRALDWMHSVRVPEQRAQVDSFLTWLLAPGVDGTPQAMARRLGVMYVIWNNRMIRTYDPGRGWTDYRNCQAANRSAASLDTTCHRNHVHISLSWDGAAGLTSWWTGRALTQPYCRAVTNRAKAGSGTPQSLSASTGVTVSTIPAIAVLDTAGGRGAGLANACRMLAGRVLHPHVRVSGLVPKSAKAVSVRISASSNAPAVLSVRSTRTAKAAQLAVGPSSSAATFLVPIASDGTIAITTSKGAANVAVAVLGYVGSALPSTPVASPVTNTSPTPTPPAASPTPAPEARPVTTASSRPSKARSITASAASTPAGGTVATRWEAPTSDGGDPALTYRVEALASSLKGAAVLGTCTAASAQRTCPVAGLPTGTRVWMSVSVANGAGRTWSPRRAVRIP